MSVFADTSALLALLNADDPDHPRAARAAEGLLAGGQLVTHSFVLAECTALVQARLGMDAVRGLLGELLPVIDVVWVDEPLFDRAASALLSARRRAVSLVDWTSFELMHQRGIARAFALDADFADQGFELVT